MYKDGAGLGLNWFHSDESRKKKKQKWRWKIWSVLFFGRGSVEKMKSEIPLYYPI